MPYANPEREREYKREYQRRPERKLYVALWKERNREHLREYFRNYKRRTKPYLSRYGLTSKDYERLLQEQGGKCAICGSTLSGRKTHALFVDHDKLTQIVRGLLCMRCNTGIGLFEDNPVLFASAKAYLERAIILSLLQAQNTSRV